MIPVCPIRISCQTKMLIKSASLTHDIDGKSTESYDSIIRRAMASLIGDKKTDAENGDLNE